jgi:hypothetical protein
MFETEFHAFLLATAKQGDADAQSGNAIIRLYLLSKTSIPSQSSGTPTF